MQIDAELAQEEVVLRKFSGMVHSILNCLNNGPRRRQFMEELVDVLYDQARNPGPRVAMRTITLICDDPVLLQMAEELEHTIVSTPFLVKLQKRAMDIQIDELRFFNISDTTSPEFNNQNTPQIFRDMLLKLSVKYSHLLVEVIHDIDNVGIRPLLFQYGPINTADLKLYVHLKEYIEWFGETNEDNRMVLQTIANSLQTILESDEKGEEA